ncbi:MAG: cytochrome-c oxidase [Marinilabiliales bacterium]|nr:MAG: cytochrome-c oxidase [Marinilabiliales bacterium]
MSDENTVHITSYKEHISTWAALMLLTFMTVAVSVFGAELRTLSVATAMIIATVKATAVGYYFMHIKYDPKLYKWMMGTVLALFVFFMIMLTIDYLTR